MSRKELKLRKKISELMFKSLHVDSLMEIGIITGGSMDIGLKEPWFSLVGNGEKVVEGRLYGEKWKNLKSFDVVTFLNGDRRIMCRILYTKIYNSFREMLESEGLGRVLPPKSGVKTINDGVNIYENIYGDDKKKAIAIGIEVINKSFK